ncbi:TIGR00725 family protein [Thermodesulfobacteriota bacterium]
MNRPLIIGVMGGGTTGDKELEDAYTLGTLIARQGWILLNGGRNTGVMESSARGSSDQGGLTIGILPGSNPKDASKYIRIPIVTGLGNARNCINVLSSDVVVACSGGMGTLSEIALALKCSKPVILLNYKKEKRFEPFQHAGRLFYAGSPQEVIDRILGLQPDQPE